MSINISKDYCDCYGLFIIMEIYGLLLVMFPSDLSLDWSPHPWGRYEGGIKVGYKGVRIVFFNRFDCRWSCEAVISLRMIHLLRLSTELNIFMCEVGCYRRRSAESVLSRSVGRSRLHHNQQCNQQPSCAFIFWGCGNYVVCKSPPNKLWMTFQFARNLRSFVSFRGPSPIICIGF